MRLAQLVINDNHRLLYRPQLSMWLKPGQNSQDPRERWGGRLKKPYVERQLSQILETMNIHNLSFPPGYR